MRATVIGLLALATAQACEPAGTCQPGRCGTVVFVTVAEPTTLNPALATMAEERDVHDQIFEKLADLGPELSTIGDSGFVPHLAASWTREDSLTIVFRLDPEARWHDGEPVRARDVVFSYRAYTDPQVASPLASSLREIDAVEPRDSLTVAVRFRRPYGAQFYDAVYHMRILPAHLLATVPGAEWARAPFSRSPVGSGPYRFVRWDPGQRIVLEADTGHYRVVPGVARLIFRGVGGFEPIAASLAAGEADATEVMMFGPLRERLLGVPHLRAVDFDSPAYGYLAFNFRDPQAPDRSHPILSDRRVRRALVMAVDRTTIVRAVLGDRGRAGIGPHTKLQWMWSPDLPRLPYDTAQAGQLLGEAGWRDRDGDGVRDRNGRPLRLRVNSLATSSLRHDFALLVQDAWRRVGVDAVLDEVDPATRAERDRRGAFDVTFGSWAVDPDPSGVRQLWTPAGFGGGNWWRYDDPEYTRLVDEAVYERERGRALALWRAAVERINEEAPALFLYELTQTAWVHQRIVDPAVRPDSWWALLSTWRIDPAATLPRDRVER